MHTCKHTQTLCLHTAHTHTHTQTYRNHTRTQTHTHTHTHPHTHTHTHTHTQLTVCPQRCKARAMMTTRHDFCEINCFCFLNPGASVTQWACQRGPGDYQSPSKANPGFHSGGWQGGCGGWWLC